MTLISVEKKMIVANESETEKVEKFLSGETECECDYKVYDRENWKVYYVPDSTNEKIIVKILEEAIK